MDKANPCEHVPSGKIDNEEACPHLAIKPTVVLKDQAEITIQHLAAENLLTLWQDSGTKVVHCMDGYDRTIEPSTAASIQQHISNTELQDIWTAGISDDVSEEDALFGDDYPHGPVVELGLLSRDGGIWEIKQEPFSLRELTMPATRKPFRHAIFREECNNGKQDVWPTVVFPEQPNICYRVRTLAGLLGWLHGEETEFWRIISPSPIASLHTSRGRGEKCCAMTEDGEVYHWNRDGEVGARQSSTLQTALSNSQENQNSEAELSIPARIDIPAVKTIALGMRMGAVVTREGTLNVFSLKKSSQKDLYTPHLTDLDDGTPENRIALPFVPQ